MYASPDIWSGNFQKSDTEFVLIFLEICLFLVFFISYVYVCVGYDNNNE